MQYKQFVLDSLAQASEIALNKFGKVSSTIKPHDNNQVLTEADLAIGKLIVDKIKEEFSDHNIIDEESGVLDRNSEFTWVVDPIDGTSNFASGVPTYGIMVGLLKGVTPIVGGVSLPYFKEIYYAEKGKGTHLNNKRISVTSETDISKLLIAYGIDPHKEDPDYSRDEVKIMAEIMLAGRNIRTSNSVFDFMMVAKGNYGAVLNQTSKIWDHVALQSILEEAGAVYTDFWGNNMDYSSPLNKVEQNFTCCVASPLIHQRLQEIIQQY